MSLATHGYAESWSLRVSGQASVRDIVSVSVALSTSLVTLDAGACRSTVCMKALDSGEEEEEEGAIMTDKYSFKMAAEKSEKKRSSAQAPLPAMLGKMFALCISGPSFCFPQVSNIMALVDFQGEVQCLEEALQETPAAALQANEVRRRQANPRVQKHPEHWRNVGMCQYPAILPYHEFLEKLGQGSEQLPQRPRFLELQRPQLPAPPAQRPGSRRKTAQVRLAAVQQSVVQPLERKLCLVRPIIFCKHVEGYPSQMYEMGKQIGAGTFVTVWKAKRRDPVIAQVNVGLVPEMSCIVLGGWKLWLTVYGWLMWSQPECNDTSTAASQFHSDYSDSIVRAARASAMQPQKRQQRLDTGLSLAQVIRCFGSPEPPSQEGWDATQVPEEELQTKEEDVNTEEVVKEELQPEVEEENEDAQEYLKEELEWKEEAEEEVLMQKEEQEEVDIYSQSTAAGISCASQSLSQESWQPFSQDSDATEHGLQLVDAPGMQEPRGSFTDLRQEEKDRLLTVSENLEKEIGMKPFYTFDARTSRDDLKKLVHTFFSRYRQTESEDHYYETERFFQNNQLRFATTLITPSFYQRSFRGEPMLHRNMAETSACRKFLEDTAAREAARNLPPPSRVLRRYITGMLNRDWKNDMLQRGICPKRVQQDAVQALSDKLRSMGCRLALWDDNA
ncbi:unnamed protein product [Symbiodinium microadriaticum]|nr:unnamed protein product [Symbiodinium microadriaticum]